MENENGEFCATGYMPAIREGDEIDLIGYWTEHPKYGMQFNFERYEVQAPTTKRGIIAYLSSVAYGVGIVKATKIYEALGEKALAIIQDNPQKLYEITCITKEQADQIISSFQENRILAELTAMICREGITPNLAAKIVNQYGKDSLQTVKENPYQLSEDIAGIGFLTADKIGRAIGIAYDSPFRIQAAVRHVLKEAESDGHCFLTPNEIYFRVLKLIGESYGLSVQDVADAVRELMNRDLLVREGDSIYDKTLYDAEAKLAEYMLVLVKQEPKEIEGLTELVERTESILQVEYAPEQLQAVKKAMTNSLSIITGGPGTGKTTTIQAIITAYRLLNPNKNVLLAAPTGRAAKRMGEATGFPAKTIHRLLKYQYDGGFEYDEYNQLPAGLLVVDEFSMADVELSKSLFAAIPEDMTVVLVGDIDQLPSVGAGAVLRDSIESGVIPTTRLRFNYRQAGGSKIAEYANLMVEGETPPLVSQGDWFVRLADGAEDTAEKVLEEVFKATTIDGYGIMDFQVLAPMRNGAAGVNALNERIRELVNPKSDQKPELPYGKTGFRLGDKVMVIENDYNLGVFNGDMGLIVGIGANKDSLTVDIEGEEVTFKAEQLSKLTLAYASTVHKSQGSEFPLVITTCIKSYYIMLARNLLYTAVTRAKRKLVLICDEYSVKHSVKNDKVTERYSRLKERLREGEGD